MSRRSTVFGLSTKILVMPAIVVVLGGLFITVMGRRLMGFEAQRQTKERSELLWQALASDRAGMGGGGFVAGNPASPVYEFRKSFRNSGSRTGDPYEQQLILTFDADRHLQRLDDTTTRHGVPYSVIASPILSQGRDSAVAGVNVLYVPVGPIHEQLARSFWTVAATFGFVVAACAALLVWRINSAITRPLGRLLHTSEALRRGEWNVRFQAGFPDEVSSLAQSFQETTLWLRHRLVKEEKLRAMFQQFVPAPVAAKALGKDDESIVAGARRPVSVMFLNIRNFKLLMEQLPPDQIVTVLNEFFTEINKVIVANQGIVSKYLGDSVMAIFGMPLGNDDHAVQAVRAALGIPTALQKLFVRMEDKQGWESGVGVGISTGDPIVGHFGSSEHMEYTLLGDVVIEAHRLEKMSKSVPEEDTILISEATYRLVMSEVHVYDLGLKVSHDGMPIHPYVVQGFRSEARSVLAA